VPEALENLRVAESELLTTDASPADLASNRLAQARAHFLVGDLAQAALDARACLADLPDTAPISRAEGLVLLGQVAFHEGDHEGARELYRRAILELSAVGADRSAAQLWFELGGLFMSVGCQAEALDAFQRAGASSGLRPVDPVTPLTPVRDRQSA
jgi:tetratricopeptide (TPR) repeat protein